MRKVPNISLLTGIFAAAIILITCPLLAHGQDDACRDEWPGYTVRSVKIEARWVPPIDLPLKRGELFTPEKLRDSRLKVIDAIGASKDKYVGDFIALGKLPLVDVKFVRACGRRVPDADCRADGLTSNCIDVVIHPYAISTDPTFLGSVFLPLPRSNRPTFLGDVPTKLRLSDPSFGLAYDNNLGIIPSVNMSLDLLTIDKILKREPTTNRRSQLLFTAGGTFSTKNSSHDLKAELSYRFRRPNKNTDDVGIDAGFSSVLEPQLDSRVQKNSFWVGGHLSFDPAITIINHVSLGGRYRRSHVRIGDPKPADLSTVEDSFDASAIFDGRIADGFGRLGLWFDRGAPVRPLKNYTRVAGLFGYEKELPVGGYTIGIEILAGAGRASRDTPPYGLFFGGRAENDFLFKDESISDAFRFPAGPVLRSFGQNQAGIAVAGGTQRGASSYEHFNSTISIPIPGLSAPLIPDEVVNDDPRVTLRDLVDFAVNSGQEALSSNLQDQGLSGEDADKKAARIFSQIRPGVKYLTNYAKIYAVKPIVMFDAARMSRSDIGSQTRFAFGGGLQFIVVVAKFEVGYLRSIRRTPGDPSGSVMFSLGFQNLF